MKSTFFDLFDKNGDNALSIEEFAELYHVTLTSNVKQQNFARVINMDMK